MLIPSLDEKHISGNPAEDETAVMELNRPERKEILMGVRECRLDAWRVRRRIFLGRIPKRGRTGIMGLFCPWKEIRPGRHFNMRYIPAAGREKRKAPAERQGPAFLSESAQEEGCASRCGLLPSESSERRHGRGQPSGGFASFCGCVFFPERPPQRCDVCRREETGGQGPVSVAAVDTWRCPLLKTAGCPNRRSVFRFLPSRQTARKLWGPA